MDRPNDGLLEKVADYYSGKLAQHGATSKGVDWKDRESHNNRHRQFLRLFGSDYAASILDLGCGFGDFCQFLRNEGYLGTFFGYDVAPSMVAEAQRLYAEDRSAHWRVGASPVERVDFVVASGIFNVKGDIPTAAWRRYVDETIASIAQLGTRGFGFNVLSTSGDSEYRRPDLFYADPVEFLEICILRFGRSVALLQDYGLYEFTILVKNANPAPR